MVKLAGKRIAILVTDGFEVSELTSPRDALLEAGAAVDVIAICHGPWTLIDAGGVKGRRLTSWVSLRKDLENAGAQWEDADVVVDRGLVTSRKPEDLPAFNAKLIEEVCEGRHAA